MSGPFTNLSNSRWLSPSKQIEKLGVITSRGSDLTEDDEIETTVIIYQFTSKTGRVSKPVSGKGTTIKGALANANLESNFELVPGKIELELFGMELAKKGIFPYLDTLNRDARLPDSMYLAISDPTAKEILTTNEQNISNNIGEHLHGLIDENAADHLLPRVTLQSFLSKYYDIGVDPALPIIEVQGNVPKIKSIAILRDDKYVGEIESKYLLLFQILEETVRNKKFELTLPLKPFEKLIRDNNKATKNSDELHIAMGLVKSKVKSSLVDKQNRLFQTNLTMDVNLLETSEPIALNDPKSLSLLEKEIEKRIKNIANESFAKLQKMDADTFGYGKIYRMHQKDGKLTDEEWREKYPTIKVDFNVKTTITRHGSTD
ncbi:Ger(x)C family spore germination protein [Oceanobacillus sp. 143]|nr:Ger(x)C family spore germination protein [Oceanobacillus sp. 143]